MLEKHIVVHIYICAYLGFPCGLVVTLCRSRKRFRFNLGLEDPLEEGMATHSSVLAWRLPWTEEPGGLQSMGSQRAGHD